MKRAAMGLLLLAGTVLGSCGDKDRTPKTADEVVAEAGKLAKPQPGQYETTVKLLKFTVPGLPPQQAERIKEMMGDVGEQASRSCLTPQEASKGFEESIRKIGEGQGGLQCDFDRFDVDGSKIAAEMVCTGAQGLSSNMTLDGTATAQQTSLRMSIVQKAAMIPGGEMHMEMQMESRRTGDCPS